jgi:hypothetical protein
MKGKSKVGFIDSDSLLAKTPFDDDLGPSFNLYIDDESDIEHSRFWEYDAYDLRGPLDDPTRAKVEDEKEALRILNTSLISLDSFKVIRDKTSIPLPNNMLKEVNWYLRPTTRPYEPGTISISTLGRGASKIDRIMVRICKLRRHGTLIQKLTQPNKVVDEFDTSDDVAPPWWVNFGLADMPNDWTYFLIHEESKIPYDLMMLDHEMSYFRVNAHTELQRRFNDEGKRYVHKGIDIGTGHTPGLTLVNPVNGYVNRVWLSDTTAGKSVNMIWCIDGIGFVSAMFFHLRSFEFSDLKWMPAGEVLGIVGYTGLDPENGEHIHLELYDVNEDMQAYSHEERAEIIRTGSNFKVGTRYPIVPSSLFRARDLLVKYLERNDKW